MRRVSAIAGLAAVLALADAGQATAATAPVPRSFVGVVADGPLLDAARVPLAPQLDSMGGAGVGSLRVQVDWSAAQPYARWSDVPDDQRARFRSDKSGVPTDYSAIDPLVEGATQRGISVLPVIGIAPAWDARHPGDVASPPRRSGPYARFAAALARRYGPRGAFWAEHLDLRPLPIRHWQFWNEPSLKQFWSGRGWAKGYVALLRAARKAVRAVDPGARVVLAGLPNRSWKALAAIYDRHARGLFDVVAIHPFTHDPDGVVTILRRARRVMRRRGDAHKPLMVTELSWTSALHRTEWTYGNETTERGQARNLTRAFRLLAANRRRLRVTRVYWYTWLSLDRDPRYPFDYAGLSRLEQNGRVVHKPAFRAFRRVAHALEGR